LRVRRTPDSPVVMLATLPGELHGLGMQMTALGAAAHGLGIRILGVDTPVASIVRAASEVQPDLVAISVSSNSGGAETHRALTELRQQLPASMRLVAGGGGMQSARRSPKGVEVPKDLAAWDKIIAALAAGRMNP
ncbi:MAG: cobalamin B12-binding domain-containing protein, partial [Planctomycetota bacterium]|nr:cobalamin B12-binding domain-containing protein [Planctomycetota bacterium]